MNVRLQGFASVILPVACGRDTDVEVDARLTTAG